MHCDLPNIKLILLNIFEGQVLIFYCGEEEMVLIFLMSGIILVLLAASTLSQILSHIAFSGNVFFLV